MKQHRHWFFLQYVYICFRYFPKNSDAVTLRGTWNRTARATSPWRMPAAAVEEVAADCCLIYSHYRRWTRCFRPRPSRRSSVAVVAPCNKARIKMDRFFSWWANNNATLFNSLNIIYSRHTHSVVHTVIQFRPYCRINPNTVKKTCSRLMERKFLSIFCTHVHTYTCDTLISRCLKYISSSKQEPARESQWSRRRVAPPPVPHCSRSLLRRWWRQLDRPLHDRQSHCHLYRPTKCAGDFRDWACPQVKEFPDAGWMSESFRTKITTLRKKNVIEDNRTIKISFITYSICSTSAYVLMLSNQTRQDRNKIINVARK